MLLSLGLLAWMAGAQWLAAALPSPLNYGATGDGVADDTVAVVSALSHGGTVGLLGQSYRVRQSLGVPAGTRLIGPGTLIVDYDAYNQTDANSALQLQGDGIELRGFALLKRFTQGSWAIGIAAQNRRDLRLEGLEISGYSAGAGVRLQGCTGVQIASLWVHDFRLDWVRNLASLPVAGLRLLDCRDVVVRHSRFDHLEVGPAVRAFAPAGQPQGYATAGVYLAGCREVVLEGNGFAVLGRGIQALDTQGCVFNANTLRDTWAAAIDLLRCSYNCVLGNQISACGQGVALAGGTATVPLAEGTAQTSNGNVIKGNQVLDSGAAGYFGVAVSERGLPSSSAISQLTGHAYNLINDHVLARSAANPAASVSIAADGATLNSQQQDNIGWTEAQALFAPAPLPAAAPNPPTTPITIMNQARAWTLLE